MLKNKSKIFVDKEIKKIEKEIYQIIKRAEYANIYYEENNSKGLDTNYLINQKDIKIFHFIFKYLFKSLKFKEFLFFFHFRDKIIISKQNPEKNINSKNSIEKINYLISKFINFCLLNHAKIADLFHMSNSYLFDNILKITKIFFLNNFINEKDLQMILYIQIILSLYKNNEKSINIKNEKQLYKVIDYLLSFCSNNDYSMTNNKIEQFNNLINGIIDIINDKILVNNNYNNKYFLARNISFYKIIGLSKITSFNITSKIIKLLVYIYAYKLNIDYIFDDLSEQFLYKTKKESLSSKTKLLISKNIFLNELLEKEKQLLKEEELFIKNGFFFIDYPKNGIECFSVNKFPNENDGYSIVVSFRLMNGDKNNNKDIYTIFSLMNKENNIFHFYIEDNKVKLKVKKEKNPKELYKISNNTNYVLWIIQSRSKKNKMILYLNNCKNIINSIFYPEGYYKINLGFGNNNNPNNISKDNFVGIIGTFMLFKKCLIKDENDFMGVTKITELKGNYEDIIYVNTKREWGFIEKKLNWILNKMDNDIDIYKDIDIIISTKSLGNLKLLNEKNNILEELQTEIYCNYFKNSLIKNEVKYSFINKNFLEDHLNFPLYFHNTFIDCLNNHIFLYLQLELYYFIGLFSSKISELKEEDKNIKINIFSNTTEEEEFYINISKICNLFFFCIDSFNSITCLNSLQEKIFQNEIDNFKYTLSDLVSIYSKYGYKIKIYFLRLFIEKLSEKKYFEYCLFILTFEFYDINNNEIFDVLFNFLNNISIEDCDNNQIKKLFLKIINFDKIYISDKIQKNTKKEYSKFLRYLIKKSIEEQLNECFETYINKLKNFKTNFEKNNEFNSMLDIQEEEYNNENEKDDNKISDDINNNEKTIKKKSKSRKESSTKKSIDISNNINNDKKESNNFELLILIYKYLKNLYIGINDVKKKFIEICANMKDKILEFFNQLFDSLCEVYPIEDDGKIQNFTLGEKDKKEWTLAELIKCLCIRFLDDLFFEENLKIVKDQESKKQEGEIGNDSKKGSSSNLNNLYNSCKMTLRPNNLNNSKIKKYSFKKDGLSGDLTSKSNPLIKSSKSSFIGSNNNLYCTVQEILTSKMEFFGNFILSPYTFKSLYLMLFRHLPNNLKIKFIKDDKIKKKLLISEKHFSKTRYLLRIIIYLFEKQYNSGFDTIFMTKIQLFEYSYNKFTELLKDMLENYVKSDDEKKKKLKPMINNIFVDKGAFYDIHEYFKIMIDNLISNYNYNGLTKETIALTKVNLDKLLLQIQNDIKELINNSLIELVDPFYFKLLAEIYFVNNKNNEFIINVVIMMIENIINKMDKENKNRIIEINSKNILILLYKMYFYVKKRNLILNSENGIFLKNVFLFLSKFIQNCNILYTKILFPIEDKRGKLLIEILYEIILEMHLDSLRNPENKSLQIAVLLLKSLFDEKNIKKNLDMNIIKHKKSSKNKEENIETYSPFYIMDKLSYFSLPDNLKDIIRISDDINIKKQFYDLNDYIILNKYKDEYKNNKNLFSSCILFCIKIILSIKELNTFFNENKILSRTHSSNSETNNNKNMLINNDNIINFNNPNEDLFILELKSHFIILCKNILKIHKEYTSSNPFKSIGYYARNIYEYFRSFIVDKLSFIEGDSNIKMEELIKDITSYKSDIKFFDRVIYTENGRTIFYSKEKFSQILKSVKNSMNKDNDIIESFNDIKSKHSSEGRNSSQFSNSLKGSFVSNDELLAMNQSNIKSKNSDGAYSNGFGRRNSLNQISQKDNLLNKSILENNNIFIYRKTIKFTKDLIRTYFSPYFKKLLIYDEDFINIKHLYIMTYYKEIKDIDKYGILYPTKIKNYITNNYDKIFLKRDFNFFSDGYFKYSHNYLYNKRNKYNYNIQNKLLFPKKKLIDENDSAHMDIPSIINNLIIYNCEMITVKGSIFGNILLFDNCLLFKSDLKNDKRNKDKISKDEDLNNKHYLDYACCSIDYDHLNKEKKIIIEYNNIKEVINRTFFYSWVSLEIFMKDGKSYLFNFFNEATNNEVFTFLKQKKIHIVRNISEYFKEEKFSEKWEEEKISTFDYLLLLNKLTSRSYNDPNQYPIMPWLFLEKGIDSIRNFDLPISIQDDEKIELYLSNKHNYLSGENSISHGNHYSTSAYICFYLMRANPFTNNMIRFQSNSFDIPDRQYTDMKQTIFLCQEMKNNREIIPELFSIPEIYINLNDNDFGRQKDGTRVHNITFKPYCDNPMEFCYLLKDLVNNNIDINNQINKWFDFIFGVNQLNNKKNTNNEEKQKFNCLRKFNDHCYGQLYNIKKLILEGQKQNKNYRDLYDEIKMAINISISFGQCPYQILNEVHPSKNKNIKVIDNCSKMSSDTPMNENNNLNECKNKANNQDFQNTSKKNNKKIKQTIKKGKGSKEIYKIKGGGDIFYFKKGFTNNYLYCLLNNSVFEIYKIDNKEENQFILIKKIIPKNQFLFFKKAKNQNIIFKPKFIFCEFNENSFIFCCTMDKTLKYYNYVEDIEDSFLLKSYTTCIIHANNNEFITAHDNGRICKWRINYSNNDKKLHLELLLFLKSNKNSITCITYNEKFNIIISCDINTVVIRKYYDFEYLTSIDIKNEENLKKLIVDIKVSEYDFIYVLIYIEETDSYELQGYTLNGTYFGKYEGNISNFQISQTGKIIIGFINNPIIKVLNPINFDEIYLKKLDIKEENIFYHFYFEMPNIIYLGIKDKDSTRIQFFSLDLEEEKYFI